MTHPSRLLTGLLTACTLAACASILPKPPEPVCGPAIDRGSVLVVDMTGYGPGDPRVDAAVRDRVGEYRIMTGEPVWIPRRSTGSRLGYEGSIATVQSIAADWGCNLLILLDTKMDRTDVMVQARNEERVWLVHAGRVGDG